MQKTGLQEHDLVRMGQALGRLLQPGMVLLLEGPMGAGKTTFVRALADGLGVTHPERVRSPTFNLCLLHPGPITLVHVDLYRLGSSPEPPGDKVGTAAFEALGLEEMAQEIMETRPISDGSPGVLVVEWADLWPDTPREHIRVRLEPEREDTSPGSFRVASGRRSLRATSAGTRAAALIRDWGRSLGERC